MKRIFSCLLVLVLTLSLGLFIGPNMVESAETITQIGSAYTFDSDASYPAVKKIDDDDYLMVFTDGDFDGNAFIQTIDKAAGTYSQGASVEFEAGSAYRNQVAQVDSTHFINGYRETTDSRMVILTVDTGAKTVTAGTAQAFTTRNVSNGLDLIEIDSTHILTVYGDTSAGGGYARVVAVNVGTDAITAGTEATFTSNSAYNMSLTQVDSTHYVAMYSDDDNGDTWGVMLTVDTGTDTVTYGTPVNISQTGGMNWMGYIRLVKMTGDYYLAIYYDEDDAQIKGAVVTIDPSTYSITPDTPQVIVASDQGGNLPSIKVDSSKVIFLYDTSSGGYASLVQMEGATGSVSQVATYNFAADPYGSGDMAQIDETMFLGAYVDDPVTSEWKGKNAMFSVSGFEEDQANIGVDVAEVVSLDCGTDVDFGTITPGTPVSASTTCEVTTNAENGYTLQVRRDDADTTMDHTTDDTSNITDKTAWTGTGGTTETWTGTGLGFAVYTSTTGSKNTTDWGAGTACHDALNEYTGFPSSYQEVLTHSSYSATSTTTGICYRVDIPSTQKSGSYDGTITYQVYTNP